ncbi:MAG: multidrug efflux RND transporter permease subunit [Acidobacteria bacterium]|nr:multidrug efflux RND transporter permease subunit [Acidobacteriota bacterium]
MFTDVFIRRPVLATVCSLLIILAGAIAIPTLPIARYPELAPPSVQVLAFYTGANAQTVESAVTTPLEQAINGVEGMTYIQSSSTNAGVSTITVTFDISRNQDLAAVDVQNRVNSALGRMPADVRTNGITVTKVSAGFMGGLGFFSQDNRYSNQFISNYLDLYVRDAIKRVPGVGDVIIFGERRYAMRLWLDPARLAARQLTAGDVMNALREQNVQVAAGALGDQPAPAGQMFTMSVRAVGRLTEVSEFENVVVQAGPDGALVRLSDVGRVELGAEQYAANLRFLGLEASGMGIALLPSANALEVFDGVMETMARLEPGFPPGLEWRLAFDNVSVVRESIIEVLKTLAEAIGLVIVVMFLFLQNWRSTIIPAVTIPVSLVGTFAFIKLFDFSINTLTLFGIVLATGIVVDDAIVVIENIERHMSEYKKSARRAAIDAMREVLSAVVVIGIVLVAVFVPVALFPGVTGRLYQQFSLTIAFAVVLSVFNAVTLTPALSALLLDKESHSHGVFFNTVNAIIDGGTRFYVTVVRGALRFRYAMLVLFAGGLWATYTLLQVVPTAFVPEEDEGFLICVVQAPAGASLEYTTEIAKKAEQILYADPDIAAAFSVMGFSFAGAAPNNGLIFTRLKDYAERAGPEHSLRAVLDRVSGPLFMIPGAIVVAFPPPAIQGLSTFGGFQFEVLDQTNSADIGGLAQATFGLIGAGNRSGRVQGLFSSFRADDPQLVVEIDRDRARSLGLPLREVTDALQVFLGSSYVNDFDFNNRAYRVYAQADQRFRATPADLTQLYARAASGAMVPLDTVVRMKETTSPQVISHFNLFRSAEITGNAAPGLSSGQALQAMEDLARQTLPPGVGFAWAGQSLEEIKAGTQASLIFGLSVILVYLVLAAQYESWVLPFIILLGVPLAVIGALSAQLLRGLANDVFCQIGLVLLIGLAAKNSILIVEFAEQMRARGLSIVDAAVEASRIRLRPILMTSFAFILGVLPLALATGAGAAARNSVGTAVAGGMLASTFLSILFIPVLYVIIRTLAPGKVRGQDEEAEAPGGPGHAATAGAVVVLVLAVAAPAMAQAADAGPTLAPATLTAALTASAGQSAPPPPPAGQPAVPVPTVAFDQAVAAAGDQNLAVRIVANNVLRAEALLQQVRASAMPFVNVTVVNSTLDGDRGFDGLVVQPQNQWTLAPTVGMPVLAAAAWAARAQQADRIEIARLDTADARRQIAVSAATAYLAVITQKRLVDVQQRALETSRAQFDYNRKRLEGGVGSRLNALRAQQIVSSDEALLEVARLNVQRAQEALGVLLDADGPRDVAGEPAFEVPVIGEPESWLASRTDYRLFSARRDLSDRIVRDSKRDWWPTANVSFDPTYVAPAGLFQPSGTWRLTVSLIQPVYDGGRRRGLRREREANLSDSELALEQLALQARAEVRTARAAVEYHERALASARAAAAAANEVLTITITAFDAGATTNIEVIDAQRSARDLETAVAQAEDRVRQARLDLLVAMGRFPQ